MARGVEVSKALPPRASVSPRRPAAGIVSAAFRFLAVHSRARPLLRRDIRAGSRGGEAVAAAVATGQRAP